MFQIIAFGLLVHFLIPSRLAAPSQDEKIGEIIQQAFAVDTPMNNFAGTGSSYSLFPTHAPTDKLPDLLPGLAMTVSTAPTATSTATITLTRTARAGRLGVTSTSIVPTPASTASTTRRVRPGRVQTTSIETTATPTPSSTPATTLTRTARPVLITSLASSISTTTTTTQATTTRRSRVIVPVGRPLARPTQRPRVAAPQARRPGGGTRGDSPLVLDINHDGIVSAALGTGISLNNSNWLERTGGATDGDKMLAMCDLNKNGVIDGTEVFGDLTEFPLWNKNISKEANGFDALGDVARSLEKQYPDIRIIEHQKNSSDTFVMLKPLQLALQRFGCDLGFISDDNRDPSKLEPLGDVAGIEINNYVEDPQAKLIRNGVASRQLGYYIDTKNQRWPVNDVWFIV